MPIHIPLLQRYVLKEFFPPFGLGLLVFTFILTMHQLFLMMDLFLNRGVGALVISRMAFLILPMFLPLSIPMASLLAVLVVYGRFYEDGELTALRSAGCALIQYSWPNILLGLLFSVFLLQFNLNVAPRSTLEFKNIYHTVALQNPLSLFAPKVMNHFGEYKIIVEEMDRKKKKISGISIYKMNPIGAPSTIFAPEGELNSSPSDGITLELTNGAIHQPNPDKDNEYTITKFNRFALRIPSKIEHQDRAVSPRELTYRDLKDEIRRSLENKISPAPWQTERDLRIAVAFAPMIFIILGIALGIQFKRGSTSIGFGLSIMVILGYYGLLVLMVSLSSRGFLPSYFLTWVPNLVALTLGGFLWHRLAKQ